MIDFYINPFIDLIIRILAGIITFAAFIICTRINTDTNLDEPMKKMFFILGFLASFLIMSSFYLSLIVVLPFLILGLIFIVSLMIKFLSLIISGPITNILILINQIRRRPTMRYYHEYLRDTFRDNDYAAPVNNFNLPLNQTEGGFTIRYPLEGIEPYNTEDNSRASNRLIRFFEKLDEVEQRRRRRE